MILQKIIQTLCKSKESFITHFPRATVFVKTGKSSYIPVVPLHGYS